MIAFQLRIKLDDFKPSVYRDVLIDPEITLQQLHQIIQAAMGWKDEHLYGFAALEKGESFWQEVEKRFGPVLDKDDSHKDDSKAGVREVLSDLKDEVCYAYDFGCEWFHTITLTDIKDVDCALPVLLKVNNVCPGEDGARVNTDCTDAYKAKRERAVKKLQLKTDSVEENVVLSAKAKKP